MARIFISYRRDDSADITGRIYDRLNCPLNRLYNGVRPLPGLGRLPATTVFKDVDDIAPGQRWKEALDKALDQCDVLLAIIGPDWVGDLGSGQRRIDNPDDMVRREIAAGLARPDVTVVPILVKGTESLPPNLPPDLQALSGRQIHHVRNDPDFHHNMDRLVRQFQPLCHRRVMMAFSVAAVLLLVAITGFIITLTRPANGIAPGAPTTTPAATSVAAADTPSQAPSELPPSDTAAPTAQPSATTAPTLSPSVATTVPPLVATVASSTTPAPTLTAPPTRAPDLRLIRSYGALVLCADQATDLSGLTVRIGNNESYTLGTLFSASAATIPGQCWCLVQPGAGLPDGCIDDDSTHREPTYYGNDWHTQAVTVTLDGQPIGACAALSSAAAVETCSFYLDSIQGGN